MEICLFPSGQFKGKDGELEIALTSSPKCFVTKTELGHWGGRSAA